MRHILIICFVILLVGTSVFADQERTMNFEQGETTTFKGNVQSTSAAECNVQRHSNYYAGYASGQAAHDKIVTYFDFSSCSAPAFPYQVNGISFMLRDLSSYQWPVNMDVVIYSAQEVNGCLKPTSELYRYSVLCDRAHFAEPNIGTVNFPNPICTSAPVFIGVEYSSPGDGPFPSLAFDTTDFPIACHNWYYFDIPQLSDKWVEWYQFWDVVPGYPLFWIHGESNSTFCASDSDNDGIPNGLDNCPLVANYYQEDYDGDGVGNVCDNCPLVPNSNQADDDLDKIGDICDDCLNDPNNDLDKDGFCENIDNCPGIYNPSQLDSNGDGRGDACENCCLNIRGNINFDSNDEIDIADIVFMIDYFFKTPQGPQPPCFEEAEINGDGSFDISDLVYIVEYALSSPSGPAPTLCP